MARASDAPLAAAVLTILGLLILLGPATWLALSLIEGMGSMSQRLDLGYFTVPSPPATVKDWPLIGEPIYQFWQLASTNLQAALAKIAPQLRAVGSRLLDIAADAGTGAIQFVIGLIVAGFLFLPAPALVDAMTQFSRRLALQKGEAFVQIAGATIRAVARGVIGVAALQAFLIGIGLVTAGVPGASLLTLASLVLGIIQIGPTLRDPTGDHLGLDRDGHDHSLAVHRLHDPGQPHRQCSAATRDGTRP